MRTRIRPELVKYVADGTLCAIPGTHETKDWKYILSFARNQNRLHPPPEEERMNEEEGKKSTDV
jgi:hypothetical protein